MSVFHEGELAAQKLAGERTTAERNSPMIANRIMPGALEFLRQQPMVIVGTLSDDGTVWASPLIGKPGFVSSLNGRQVYFDLASAAPVKRDILWCNLREGSHMGMLAIELATRRRLRVNGVLSKVSAGELVLDVREAYPNCPKFIQRRKFVWEEDAAVSNRLAEAGEGMTLDVRELFAKADTLFLATDHAERGADVSHRGGNAGFVQVLDARTLRIPEYPGNGLFNSIGNLMTNPRAGVMALDFDHGRMVQATGKARAELQGTERYIEFKVERWQLLPLPAAAHWRFIDASPYNPAVVANQ
jgi:predicted pyridoxine 5'-phosphate oxidase superfamily flavin-nucleotide-binding protein